MEEPSNTNPEKLFNFKVTPLTKLKLSFGALCDPDFNPRGLGVIEVDENGVKIMVRNSESKVTGHIFLKSTALKDFHFSSNCKDKLMMVNFNRIHLIITVADNHNEDSITIFHVDGSDNITFNFGDDPIKEFKVKLLPMFTGLERFPEIKFFCVAFIPSTTLREMVARLETIVNQLVAVYISEKNVSIFIGDLQPWIFDNTTTSRTMGVAPGQNHHARFIWPHLDMLRRASYIAPVFQLFFLTQPKGMIMTQFNLQELGDLVFISEATLIIPNSNTYYRDLVMRLYE